jgi:hypothetical protein
MMRVTIVALLALSWCDEFTSHQYVKSALQMSRDIAHFILRI